MAVFQRLIILSLLLPSIAMAQEANRRAAEKKPATPRKTPTGQAAPAPATTTVTSDADDPRAMRLSLTEAVNTAVERNLGVELERYDYRIAGYRAKAAYGPFDFFTTGTLEAVSQNRPVASDIFSSESEALRFNLGLTQRLATGGTYSVGFNNARNASNAQFTNVNPAYDTDLGFRFEQPLIRDFGVDINRREINIARNNLGISSGAFRNALILTAQAVEQAYYDLIYTRQELEVRRQSLLLARDQERITQIRIDVGASAPLDILQPRVAIATRDEEVILAEANIRDAEDRLRQLMNLDPAEWDRPIVATDTLDYSPVDVDAATAVSRAFEYRPEIEQARLGIENTRVDYLYLRNQVLPRLNFNLDYGFAGQGGRQFGSDPVTGDPVVIRQTNYFDALESVFTNDFPSWTVGVNFGVPILNIGARAERRRAELDVERATTDESRLRQEITIQVRQAVRDIETASRRISATRTAREAAQRNLEAERRRFENGMTTNFNVLLIQQDQSDARSREILAQVAYRQAVAFYHRAVGDILERHNITVQEPERFTLPGDRLEKYRWMYYGNRIERDRNGVIDKPGK